MAFAAYDRLNQDVNHIGERGKFKDKGKGSSKRKGKDVVEDSESETEEPNLCVNIEKFDSGEDSDD